MTRHIRSSNAGNVTLFARARSTTWTRLLLAVVAVPAVLVGLLAMHVLAATGDPSGQHNAMASAGLMTQVAPNTTEVSSVVGCDQWCGASHDMGAMTCILALLLTVLTVLVLAAFGGWRTAQAALAAVTAILTHPRKRAPPHPPSLELLSISRV